MKIMENKMIDKTKLCIDCGKVLSRRKYKRCKKCFLKIARSPMMGRHHSEETKYKLSIINFKFGLPKCLDCGKQLKQYNSIRCKKCNNKHLSGKNHPNYKDGKTCKTNIICPDCNGVKDRRANLCRRCNGKRIIKLKLQSKENNPAWRGGISYKDYSFRFDNILRESIRKRDKYICQICGIHQDKLKRKLDVHHIDYNKENCKENNLISLCVHCHMKTNKNREEWKNFLERGYND